ncbi:retina and anterior neural fold homeobox protein 2-like [Bubalus bubalis]|uniref:retina and anterior neural fold homeobox protein 2-like n=1 Tax=Bubalus bubalis TaxID=89462 RepID=UPI001E1B6653|nr:retina and anterior neural fold homeobox protein 2-like [Bubalus bubalis]
MQEPESVMRPTRRSAPPKRKRRQRTVYSKEQLEELKEAFLKNEYPSYQDRLRLAARLHLDEHRVQVWFKNRRAQRSRLERRQTQGGYQRAGHEPTDPGAPRTPAPAPESAAAAASPSFPDSPGFYSRPPPPSPAGVLPAPEPGISSHHPVTWVPAQGVHVYGPAAPTPAPAPAPGWPQDPDAPNYCPDPLPVLLPDCVQELFSEPSSPLNSVSPVDEDDLGSQRFTNL